MDERLNGIAVFVAVVEAGSFAAAALRLGVTASAVAKTIARVEQRLKVRLFIRTTRRQHLTDQGRAYYQHCVRALDELQAAEDAFEQDTQQVRGRLRMSVPTIFGRHCVTPIVLQLSQRFPELEVELSFNDRVVDLIEDGFDLAVRIGELANSTTLVARRLGSQRMGIAAAPAYLARYGRPLDSKALDGHAGIAYVGEKGSMPWRMHGEAGEIVEPQIRTRLRFDDLQAIADAAAQGAGLAWLPCWLMHPLIERGQLELVMSAEQVLPTPIYAVWPRTRRLGLRARIMIDALAAELSTMLKPLAPADSLVVARNEVGKGGQSALHSSIRPSLRCDT